MRSPRANCRLQKTADCRRLQTEDRHRETGAAMASETRGFVVSQPRGTGSGTGNGIGNGTSERCPPVTLVDMSSSVSADLFIITGDAIGRDTDWVTSGPDSSDP